MYFQDLIFTLQQFWTEKGCILLQPYDMELGAGTSHPATSLRCIDANPWNVVYVQPSRRPTDGRYAENPNRTQHYYQLQVIMKPSPDEIQEMCLESLAKIGISRKEHDLRFVESDWENPTLGAWGLGWEIWCDGMEIVQFTYMQQLGGLECKPIPGEVTYGLERLAMYVQNVNSFWDIKWNKAGVTYKDIFFYNEVEYSKYNFEFADVDMLKRSFSSHINEAERLLELNIVQPAYDQCLKASHSFNLLEARGAFSVTERASHMGEVRNVVRKCCEKWHTLSTETKLF